MTGIAPRTSASPRSRMALHLAWAALWLLLGIASLEFLLAAYGKYRHLDSAAYGMFMTRRGWLWMHLAGDYPWGADINLYRNLSRFQKSKT